MSADCTSKTNTYMVFQYSFRYHGSPTFLVTLNPNFKFPFEGISCQWNYFYCCGTPTLLVPLNLNSEFPFEGNSCQCNNNSCQLP